MLYQLSYAHQILFLLLALLRTFPRTFSDCVRTARPAGVEPAASGLEGRCSIQLSYGRMLMISGS